MLFYQKNGSKITENSKYARYSKTTGEGEIKEQGWSFTAESWGFLVGLL